MKTSKLLSVLLSVYSASAYSIIEKNKRAEAKCWAESLGYPCCSGKNPKVYAHDNDGDWGYNFATGEWCGISTFDDRVNDEACWSESLGYSCCHGCTIYETDDDGSWGYENDSWCGIQSYCKSEEKPNENEESELKPNEYPTDIFKVEDKKIYDFDEDLVFDGTQATNLTFNKDGSVTYVASALGSGGGVVFYVKKDKSIINLSNYESVDIELVFSPVNGKWNPDAKAPSFGFRVFTREATGFWSGFEDVEYFGEENGAFYGTLKKNVILTDKIKESFIENCSNDDVLGFTLKFNAYQTGNNESDELMVQIKKVKFNKIPGTPEDKYTDDGLTDKDRGTVSHIEYPTHDYMTDDENDKYNKPAWVYLPAGYDPEDKNTKYPLVILMHGFGQNEDNWGLTDQGTGGKIKGMMDRGMAKAKDEEGSVEKFVLIVPTGMASKDFRDNNNYGNTEPWYKFGNEIRNDIIPYMRSHYNIKEGRENVAMAGLSMGGMQTLNLGIGECLDLISYFGAFSFPFGADIFEKTETNFPDKNLTIKGLYTICGDADAGAFAGYGPAVEAFEKWDRIDEGKFKSEIYPGGTHDFPVWYRGFEHLIPLLFK
ncbi:alpha/beta-hydrolase [Neocallimastix californiae]|uniref:Alpha/beta-hydrolase n=1 Tax=Neocallimastix californiae TaxID=1754190 RepID=A0A1Y2AWI7_9FUNG|nr:alpha/beta-hydrolase [Neocallimastix californiae]|eukprot:ORY26660.1 alpha/beta-hydrolase [Neocallimastix californiae]